MSNRESRVKLTVSGFVSPSLVKVIKNGCTGKVNEHGKVTIDGIDDELKQVDGSIPPGTEVYVWYRGGTTYCEPVAVREEIEKRKKRRQQEQQEQKRQRRNAKRDEANQFWKQYDIPFDHDVAIKGRRSGLTHGSDGTGRDASTVEHLFVKEAFEAGRLEREEMTYLCDGTANIRFTEERFLDGNDDEYVPKITCKQCLEMMERWKDD